MDFHIPHIDGDSHLHVAVKQSQLEDIRKILESQDVDVNALNIKDETPLSIACILRKNAIIELLVAFGANPFINNLDTYYFGIKDLLNKLLFHNDHWLKDPTLISGDTPLHTSLRLGTSGDIQKMLDQEHEIVTINYVNSCHETALHFACALGHKHIVQMLMSRGANIYLRDCYNNAPIHRAASQGCTDIYCRALDKELLV